jgi:hypothetical protein
MSRRDIILAILLAVVASLAIEGVLEAVEAVVRH